MQYTACVITILYLLYLVGSSDNLKKVQNVYQKIRDDPDLSSFNYLLKNNRIAKLDLNYQGVTVFVPEDAAFERFYGTYDQQLTYYHMSYEVKSLKDLIYVNNMTSVKEDFPPVWISKTGKSIFVNNAKVIEDRSDVLGKTADDDTGKLQMLHVLDEVLDPFIRNTSIKPTAYELLSTPHHWHLPHTLEMFFERVTDNGLTDLFQEGGGHTFFIPIDKNIDNHRYTSLDNYTIQGHIIPKQVLFTRPANKQFFYESACNGDYIYVLCSFIERGDRILAKSTTVLGDTSHPKGEILAEIVQANIPVKNGVVHLISRPLVVFDRELKPFPFLPVFYKISSDPFLDYSHNIGEKTGLNSYIQNPGKKITYFVPRNEAWKKAFEDRTYSLDEERSILGRHMILDETTYPMERLLYLSKSSADTTVNLKTISGDITVIVTRFEDSYYVAFNGTQIRVLRADYMCEDGIVHIMESPFFYEDEKYVQISEERGNGDDVVNRVDPEMNVWTVLKEIFF